MLISITMNRVTFSVLSLILGDGKYVFWFYDGKIEV